MKHSYSIQHDELDNELKLNEGMKTIRSISVKRNGRNAKIIKGDKKNGPMNRGKTIDFMENRTASVLFDFKPENRNNSEILIEAMERSIQKVQNMTEINTLSINNNNGSSI